MKKKVKRFTFSCCDFYEVKIKRYFIFLIIKFIIDTFF